MILSRLLDADPTGMFKSFMLLPVIIFGIVTIAVITIIIMVVIKAIKRHAAIHDSISEGNIANIFKKTFATAEAKLDNKTAKYKKVTCPYCGAVNKGTDTKCTGCSAPLNEK